MHQMRMSTKYPVIDRSRNMRDKRANKCKEYHSPHVWTNNDEIYQIDIQIYESKIKGNRNANKNYTKRQSTVLVYRTLFYNKNPLVSFY